MTPHDSVHRIEAHPGAFADAFGGIKRFKDVRLHRLRNAGTVVDDLDEHAVQLSRGPDGQLALAAHRINGVVDKIGPDLVQLTAMRVDPGQAGIELAFHLNSVFEPELKHSDGALYAPVHIHLLRRSLIHVCIFFDGADQLRFSVSASFNFPRHPLRADRGYDSRQDVEENIFPKLRAKSFQRSQIDAGLDQTRGESGGA